MGALCVERGRNPWPYSVSSVEVALAPEKDGCEAIVHIGVWREWADMAERTPNFRAPLEAAHTTDCRATRLLRVWRTRGFAPLFIKSC